MGGTSVTVTDFVKLACPVTYVSASRIDYQLPAATPLGRNALTATTSQGDAGMDHTSIMVE
jgi:uncharacterized protein (TIGR03437 family)